MDEIVVLVAERQVRVNRDTIGLYTRHIVNSACDTESDVRGEILHLETCQASLLHLDS